MAVWLLTDAAMDAHRLHGHPERPERRDAAAAGVRDAAGDDLTEPAVEPIADDDLHALHDPDYVTLLVAGEARGAWLDADTYLVPGSVAAARLAAGATVQAVLAATRGEAEVAFAVVRPPGHHAAAERGSGFCLFNNAALAVLAVRRAGLARRVAVLDWDVHHGNGTQDIFDADPDVLYASTHQWPLYPGTGRPEERGTGAAAGTKLNRLLSDGDGDDAFVAAWRDELLLAIESFGPESIVVSAGYDAHRADPLATLEVGEAGYREVSHLIGQLSRRLGLAGVALTLEGGYDLPALRGSVAATVRGLLSGRQASVGGG